MAKTYLFFKSSKLPQKAIDDLLLQVHGDMRRFEEVRTLLLRMAHRGMDATPSSKMYEENKKAFYQDDAESSAWSNVTDPWNQDWSSYKADELYALYEGWYDDEASWYYDYEDLQNMENGKRHGMKLVKKNLLIKPKMNLQNHPTMWMKHTSKERAHQDPQQWDSAVQRAAPSGTMRTTVR